MPDSDRMEIRCGAGMLAILPTRLLLRGPQAWAIQRAAVAKVSCAPGDKDDYAVSLRLHDGRQFVLRGFAAADLARLASALGDIDGLPPVPGSTPWDSRPLADAPSSAAPAERQAPALPQAEYRPDPADGADGDAELTPTEPMLPGARPPRGPSSLTPSRQVKPQAGTPPAAGAGVPSTALPPKIWLPHVTLPPPGGPVGAGAVAAPPNAAGRGAQGEASQGVPATAPRPPTPPPAGRTGGEAPPHPRGLPKRALWP